MPEWGRKYAAFFKAFSNQPCRPIWLQWCASPSPKRRHWSPCCMAAIPAFQCLVTSNNWTCSQHQNFKMSAMILEHEMSVDTINDIFYCYRSRCLWQFCLSTGHCTSIHHACNTVKLLERELHLWQLWTSPQQLSSEPHSHNFRDSRISIIISRKWTRLKKSSSNWSNLVK